MSAKDYYQILGVSRNATQDEIKKAFKKLAKELHPDRNPGDKQAENRFKEVSEAYQVLSDPEKRREYDAFGRAGFQGGPGFADMGRGPGGATFYTWSSGAGGAADFDFHDLFSEIFGAGRRHVDMEEVFPDEDPFDFTYHAGPPRKGRDVVADITVPFEDAARGGTRRFTIRKEGPCPTCGGSGRKRGGRSTICTACGGRGQRKVANLGTAFSVVCEACGGSGRTYTEPCPACHGSGRQAGLETITVKIPPGVDDGGRLRIPGKGEVGADGRAGDLLLRVHVTPHRYFRREGKDLHLDLPVTVSEAALGARIQVPTLEGRSTLRIPAGTQGGATLRMKGKGIPDPKGGGRGDMYVHVRLVVPKAEQNPRLKKIFQELKQYEDDPRRGLY